MDVTSGSLVDVTEKELGDENDEKECEYLTDNEEISNNHCDLEDYNQDEEQAALPLQVMAKMAASHALKELAVFLMFVFMLRSFHPSDTENTQLSIHRTDIIALYVSSMTSKANYEVFVPNSKSYAKTKMAEVLRTKQARVLLK